MSERTDKLKREFVGGLKRWAVFLAVAAVSLFIVLSPYFIGGKYLVWSKGQFADGITQHLTFLEYMFDSHGLFGGAGGYDYSLGLGADYMVSFAYYMMFDPINFLLYIMPRGNFMLSYSVLVFVRYMLSAVFMYVYLRRHKVRNGIAVLGSVGYMLCGYSFFTFVRHPDLTSGAIYLPLVVLGTELAIKKNNPFLLIFSVFIVTISSFYMAYMVTLFTVLYAAVYYVNEVKSRGEKVTAKGFAAIFFRTAGYYMLGLLLASFVLFPVAYGYFTAARSAGKGFNSYTLADIFSYFGLYVVPVPGFKYTMVMFNLCISMLAIAAVMKTKQKVYRTMTLIMAACIFVPIVGYVMNLFNYTSNRYSYLLCFCMFAFLSLHYNDERSPLPSKKAANYMAKGMVSWIIIALNIGLWALITTELFQNLPTAVVVLGYIAGVGALVGSFFGIYKLSRKDFSTRKHRREMSYKRLTLGAIIMVISGLTIFSSFLAGWGYTGMERYSELSSEAEAYYAREIQGKDPNTFVRLDTVSHGRAFDAQNRPLNGGYRGTMLYNTMAPDPVGDYLSENGIFVFMPSLGISGLNGRIASEALLSCEYYHARPDENGKAYVPYGYESVLDEGGSEVDGLYRTDNFVHFGTVFGSTMSREEYESLHILERQYAELMYVVVDEGAETEYESILTERFDLADLDFEDEFVITKNEPLEIRLKENCEGRELYVSFELAKETEIDTWFKVSCGDTSLETLTTRKGQQMYTGQTEFTFKLDEKGDVVLFEKVSGNDLTIKNIRFYTVDNEKIVERIRAAKAQSHLTDTEFSSYGFKGKIDSLGGTLLVQLPYSHGFRAFVDGKETEIVLADGGFMALNVDGGSHDIEFKYRTPAYGAGVITSIVSAGIVTALAATYTAVYFVRKKKKRGEGNE